MPEPYMTTMPIQGQPDWVSPIQSPAPDYDQLLAQAKLKMLDMPSPDIPQPRAQPVWAAPEIDGDLENFLNGLRPDQRDRFNSLTKDVQDRVFAIWQRKRDRRSVSANEDLPPSLRGIFDRLPPDMQERLRGTWENRGAGYQTRDPGGGGRDNGDRWGPGGGGNLGWEDKGPMESFGNSSSSSSGIPGFGSGPLGKGWSRGASLIGGMINPFAGLALEGGRRANNMSYANSQRDMLGIERPGAWGDFFGAGASGSPTRSIGDVNIGGRTTGVSYGGIEDNGRTTYTPEEARRRQAAQNYSGYRGGDESGGDGGYGGYGGGGDDFDPSGRW